MFKQTPLKRVLFTRVQTALIVGLFGVLLVGVLGGSFTSVFPSWFGQPQKASAATNGTMNFQARLLTSTGAVVPDGNYHIEFKIYNATGTSGSSQGSCTGDAACLWTETRTTGNLVRVVNGYFSVSLGSVTAFGSTIKWDQDLYITMNIGGSGGAASWDGEMTNAGTRMKLTGVPYAFRAGVLAKLTGANTSTLDFATQTAARSILLPDEGGTLCIQSSTNCGFATSSGSGSYIQNGTALQTTANFNIQSAAAGSVGGIIRGATSQTADLQEWQNSAGTILLRVGSSGDLVSNKTGSLLFTSNTETNLFKPEGTGNVGLAVRGLAAQSADLLQLQNSAGTVLSNFNSAGLLGINGATAGGTIAGQTAALNVTGYTGLGGLRVNGADTGNTILSASSMGITSTGGNITLTAGSGSSYVFIHNPDGAVGLGTTTTGTNNKLLVNPYSTVDNLATTQINTNAATNKGLVVQGFASQTANLQEWQSSTGGVAAYVNSDGNFAARKVHGGAATFDSNVALTASSLGSGLVVAEIRGATSQTANLLQLQNSAGTNLATFDAAGAAQIPRVSISSATAPQTYALHVDTPSASERGIVVRGAAAQTGDLLQLQNSAGTVLSKFDSAGNLSVGSSTSPTAGVAYFNGNVGIGTSSPSAALNVVGGQNSTLNIDKTGGSSRFQLFVGGGTSGYTADEAYLASNNSAINLRTGVLPYDTLSVRDTGNVGIQTSTAAANFQVNQATTSTGTVTTNGTTALVGLNTQFTNTFKVGDTITVTGETVRTIATITDNTHLTATVAFSTTASGLSYTLTGGIRFVVQGNGNVGIGTTNPQAMLHVNGRIVAGGTPNVSVPASIKLLSSDPTDAYFGAESNGVVSFLESYNGQAGLDSYNYATSTKIALNIGGFNGGGNTSNLRFWSNGSERMDITSTGNVGIGDTTPISLFTVGNGDLFQVNSSGAIVASTGITNTGGYVQSGATANTFTGASTFSSAGTGLAVTNNATVGGTLVVTGNTTVTGGTLTLNNATSNIVNFGTTGIAAPTFTTRSAGTKLVLYDGVNASSVDYGFGVESGMLWSSVRTTSQQFKWYGGTTQAALLSGTGDLTLGTGSGALTSGLINAQTISTTANFTGTLAVTTLGATNTATMLCRNASNQLAGCNTTGTGAAFIQGGNSFGATAVLGTNDANDLALETGGTTKLTVQNSTGNVGIGTVSPSTKLHVSALGTSGADTEALRLSYTNAINTSGHISMFAGDNTAESQRITYGFGAGSENGYLAFSTYNNGLSESMRILGNGSVGIGVTSPSTSLQVAENVVNSNVMTLGTASGSFSLMSSAKLYGLFAGVKYNTGDAWMQVGRSDGVATAYNLLLQPSGGNVGIGTVSATNKLTVSATNSSLTSGILQNGATTGYNFIQVTSTGGNTILGVTDSVGSTGLTGGLPYATVLASNNLTPLQLGTNGQANVTVLTSGNVGIGTTAPAAKLQVTGTTFLNGGLDIGDTAYYDANVAFSVKSSRAYLFNMYDASVNPIMGLTQTGKLTIGALSGGSLLNVKGSASVGSTYYNIAAPSNGMIIEGNVGIGTNSVGKTLDVNGTALIRSNSALTGTIDLQGALTVGSASTTGSSFFVNTASLNTSYGSGLSINGTYSNPGGIGTAVVNLTASGVQSAGGYDSALAFSTGLNGTQSEKMRINSAGNVGIGTTGPLAKLQIGDNADTSSNELRISVAGGSATASPVLLLNRSGSSSSFIAQIAGGKLLFGNDAAGNAQAALTSAAKVTFDLAAGNVGIGTTSIGTNNRLLVNAYNTVDNLATAQINANAATNKGLVVQGFASQSADFMQIQNSAGAVQVGVNSAGALYAASGRLFVDSQIETSGGGATRLAQGAVVRLSVSNTGTKINVNGTTEVALTIQGNASQTGDLTQWQNSSSTVLAKVDASGNFTLGAINASGAYTQSGSGANTFSGATTFSSTGTALAVTNNATIGGTLAVTGTTTHSGNILASNAATATTGTTEAAVKTNVTDVTLIAAGSFANNDVIFINNATGQDYYTRIVSGGGTTALVVSPAVSYGVSTPVTKYTIQNIGATATDYATQTQRFFQGYFLGGIVTGAGSTTLSDGSLSSTTYLTVSTGSTPAVRLTVDSSGNVGIGTSGTAGSILSVGGTTGNFQVNSSGAIAASTGMANSGGYVQSGSTANTFTGATTVGNTLTVTTGGATITAGDVAITAGNLSTNGIQRLTNAGALTNIASITGTGALVVASGGTNTYMSLDGKGTGGVYLSVEQGTGGVTFGNGAGGGVGGVSSTGNAVFNGSVKSDGYFSHSGSGGAYGGNLMNTDWSGGCVRQWVDTTNLGNIMCPSDQRLKTNVQSFSETKGLSAINQLNPVTFNWINPNESTTTQYGFLAQQVRNIFPELVRNTGMVTDLTPDGMLRLDYEGLIPVLVNGVKELSVQVQTQQGQLTVATNTDTTQDQSIQGLVSSMATFQVGLDGKRSLTNNTFTSINVSGPSTLASLTVTGNASIGGNLTVTGDTTVANLFVGGKIAARGAKPTTVVGAALLPANNANATVAVNGNDTAGTITIQTNQAQVLGANNQMQTVPFTSGVTAEVTFSSPYGQMPRVMMTPVNQDSVGAPFYIEKTQTGFKVIFTQAPGANKTYSFDYFVIGSEETP